MKLKDIQIYRPNITDDQSKKFSSSIIHVEYRYYYKLVKERVVTTSLTKKAIVELIPDKHEFRVIRIVDTRKVMGIVTLQVTFDFEKYWSLQGKKRYRYYLDAVQFGLVYLAKKFGWEVSKFEEVYKEIIAEDFDNFNYNLKPIASPNRKYKANIHYEYPEKEIRLYIDIRDNKGNLLTRELLEKLQHDYSLHLMIGKLKWLNNSEVEMKSKHYNKKWTVKVQASN